MAYFPFYIDIRNKVCLIVGGGRIALRKAEILLQFEAKIIIVAPKICDENYELLTKYQENIILLEREFWDDDISAAEIIIAATGDTALNAHIAQLCRTKNKLVNVVDMKDECGFIFPAIIKQEELVVSVSTGGNSPLLAVIIRQELEESISEHYGKVAGILGRYRERIKKEIADPGNRKKAYQEMIKIAEKQDGNLTTDDICNIIKGFQ